MIKTLAEQISRWMDKIAGPSLNHFTIEVINWKNVSDDQLPPDIELDVFYLVQDSTESPASIMSMIEHQPQLKELKIYHRLSRVLENFHDMPLYIQQEIMEELWRHHQTRC